DILQALAMVQVAAGDPQSAIRTFKTLIGLLPASPQALVQLGEIQLSINDNLAASESMKRALEIAPEFVAAQRGLIKATLALKQPELALGVARAAQKQRPNDAAGFELEGDIEASRANWDGAAGAFRAGLQKSATPQLAAKLESALVAGGKEAEASRFVADWQAAHPADAAFL